MLAFVQYPKQSGNCPKNPPYARCESSGDPTDSTCVGVGVERKTNSAFERLFILEGSTAVVISKTRSSILYVSLLSERRHENYETKEDTCDSSWEGFFFCLKKRARFPLPYNIYVQKQTKLAIQYCFYDY